MERLLEVSRQDGIVVLHVPAPVGFDALARLTWEIADACRAVAEEEEPATAVVVTASGPAFGVMPPASAADCDAARQGWSAATAAIAELTAPTVAVIQADAIGPAWELALACDLRLAATTARVGSPEIRWGRIPSAGGTQRLTRIAGPAVARQLLLLGQLLTADEAFRLGLVHQVAPPEGLDGLRQDLLNTLKANAPIALAYAKEAVRQGADMSLADGLRLEADLSVLLQTTRDRAEGLAAFLQRRPPHFTGH